MAIRRNYRNLSADERQRFIDALYHVKSNGTVDQFASLHVMHFTHLIHRSSHFLPWHREFLLRFEQALQQHHPDIAIPYWDSTVDRSPSDPLWSDAFLGQFNSAWNLGRRLGSSSLSTQPDVEENQTRSTYDVFWPELENPIHNLPHRWVDGVMGGTASPGDPVFYLHHGWIDLLWVRWQLAHPNAPFVSSQTGAGLNDAFMGWPDRTPASVLDHHTLGYLYDFEAPPRWASLESGATTSDPGAVLQTGGRLVVFVRGTDNSIWHRWQVTRNGEWSTWESIGAPPGGATSGPDVALNDRGGMVVFARGSDGAVWHAWQHDPDGDWSSWFSLEGEMTTSDPGAVLQTGGRLVVFVRRSDNSIWHRWQVTPNGEWSGWASVGAPPGGATSGPDTALNDRGGLVVFARGGDGAMWHTWQHDPDGDWSEWLSLGGEVTTGDPGAVLQTGGRLVVFARRADNSIWHRWQVTRNGEWSDWASIEAPPGGATSGPDPALNDAGGLVVFTRGGDGTVWHAWQEHPDGFWG